MKIVHGEEGSARFNQSPRRRIDALFRETKRATFDRGLIFIGFPCFSLCRRLFHGTEPFFELSFIWVHAEDLS